MRATILLLGLAAAPLTVVAAQGFANAVKDPAQCANADANRSPVSLSHAPKSDPHGRSRTGCSGGDPSTGDTTGTGGGGDSQPPQPPPPGSVTITGTIWDLGGGVGLQGWTVDITGPVNVSVTTDANGVYNFSGVPAGTYTICEEPLTGWSQTFPTNSASCSTGMGYTFDVPAGSTAAFVDFGNRHQ